MVRRPDQLHHRPRLPGRQRAELAKFWPADAHIIGKDILRFHTVYCRPSFWLRESPAGEGFRPRLVDRRRAKMSKSLQNVVEPNMLIDKYGVDAIRYFLLREVPHLVSTATFPTPRLFTA
ncbi:MAG: class I tRNA ligase family protein [Syntrophotaleaceae bacterium]